MRCFSLPPIYRNFDSMFSMLIRLTYCFDFRDIKIYTSLQVPKSSIDSLQSDYHLNIKTSVSILKNLHLVLVF